MARPRGANPKILENIMDLVAEHPLWLREIARQLSLSPNTVNAYVNTFPLYFEVQQIGQLLTVVSLKSSLKDLSPEERKRRTKLLSSVLEDRD